MEVFKKIRPKTIGFWAGDNNNFQFVEGVIELFSKKYLVKKFIYNGDDKKMIKEMSKVDLCWFEWGIGPIVPASNSKSKTPIISRIHRYELYSDSPRWVDWSNVDLLIFSSPSMVMKFENKFNNQAEVANYEYLPIGVDLEKFKFIDKPLTKNIVYVGRIHPHKNPSLLIQIISKLAKIDDSYKLNVIGAFADELFEEYFYDQLKKQKIEKNVNFLGQMNHKEMVSYLQEADSFIITSIVEGISQASLEAMACGTRPVIFNYYGSDKGYPKECIYNTVDEAVDMIMNPVISRRDCRKIVEEKYNKNVADRQLIQYVDDILSKNTARLRKG